MKPNNKIAVPIFMAAILILVIMISRKAEEPTTNKLSTTIAIYITDYAGVFDKEDSEFDTDDKEVMEKIILDATSEETIKKDIDGTFFPPGAAIWFILRNGDQISYNIHETDEGEILIWDGSKVRSSETLKKIVNDLRKE